MGVAARILLDAPAVGAVATFSAHGDRIHVHDRFGNLETLDRATLRPAYDTFSVGSVTAMVPHPTDGTVLGLRSDGSIIRVDPEAERVLATESLGLEYDLGEYIGGALSPDGSSLAARHPEGGVRLLDTDTFEWVGEASPIDDVGNVSFAPDGSQFASVVTGWVRLWDGRTGAYQAGVPLPDVASDATVAYLPDGGGLLVSAPDGTTWTVDTRLTAWVERSVPDCRPQPDPGRMEAVLPQPALRGHLPPVAHGQLITALLRQPRPPRRLRHTDARAGVAPNQRIYSQGLSARERRHEERPSSVSKAGRTSTVS